MYTVKFLINLVEHHQAFAYFVIFLGLIFEGEVVVIFTGVLSHLGALNFWVSLAFIFAGGLTKTFVLYYFGSLMNRKLSQNNFFKYLEKRVLYFMPNFHLKPFWSIFSSKFIMGTNYLIAIFSGYNKINYRTYLKAELFSTILWAPALLSLGYFFSEKALRVSREIGKFSLIIIISIIIFLLFDKLVASAFRIFQYITNMGHNGDKYMNGEKQKNDNEHK